MNSHNPTDVAEIDLGVLAGSDDDFRSETIYFLVLDRFFAGCPGKNREGDLLFDSSRTDWHKYWGGDLQGLWDKLPYLRSFGISSVWTTPLFEQVQALTLEDVPRAAIHGYWTSDFKRINARWLNDPSEQRLFTRNDTVFDSVLEEMHSCGMKFILDIVCNHSTPKTSAGKGRLYDDGVLIADFENDAEHWYHHYGVTKDWTDAWQVQNCEICGLATFNENNIRYRRYIKDAIKLWIGKGIDGLRIDTVKHMPLWFWQEFNSDMSVENPNVFRFGEWIDSHPAKPESTAFANKAGMSILDFGYCHAVRDCFSGRGEKGFTGIKELLDMDGNYSGATELVTFFENHDKPRLQSLGVADRAIDLALILLLTSRGVPCLYYGCEQYLHDDTNGGDDPYNRPMMKDWEHTPAMAIISKLAAERKRNPAIQLGGQWPKFVDVDSYVYLRRYRESGCLVFLNKGPDRELQATDLELPDGEYSCLLSGKTLEIVNGACKVQLGPLEGIVIARRGKPVKAKSVIRLQINHAPTQPGERLSIIGDCPELGNWDLTEAYGMECINANTWFAEVPFSESAGAPVGYKYVIFNSADRDSPRRENRVVRRRLVTPGGLAKWRDSWEA